MSAAADDAPCADDAWELLDRAAAHAVEALRAARRRAELAETEVATLRAALAEVTRRDEGDGGAAMDPAEPRRLRAENALLRSRATEARARVEALLARLAVLEIEP